MATNSSLGSGSGRFSDRWLRTAVATALACVSTVTAPTIGSATAGGSQPPEISLKAGGPAFWSGRFDGETAMSAEACLVTGKCIDYVLSVKEPAARLRVAIDHPSASDSMGIRIFDPSGSEIPNPDQREREAGEAYGALAHSHEVSVDQPTLGPWMVRVVPSNVSDSTFRMRAQLEILSPGTQGSRLLLPNLQMVPPYELTFNSDPAQQADAPSCTFIEKQNYAKSFDDVKTVDGDPRCLRFSVGPQNVGQGKWEVLVAPSEDGVLEGPARQRVYNSDGTYEDREAGRFTYHKEHKHFHHTSLSHYRLLHVEDADAGRLRRVSDGPKIGFCTGDLSIAQWNAFRSDLPRRTADTVSGVCGGSPSGGSIALTSGWGDFYYWHLEGTFVPFPARGDGLYVVQVATDIESVFLESNEDDNAAYAYIRVRGDDVEVLERGLGFSPWDSSKVVVHDTRNDNPDCPASATQVSC